MLDNGKKILMFCPTFFGYQNRMAEAFRDEGFEVCLYDERPSKSFICKAALRLNLKFYKPVVRNYIKKVINENRDKQFDYIFVVKSESMAEKEVSMLREAFPTAQMILYFWDSVANVPDGEKKIALYDRVLTFDPGDAEKYNLPFLPVPYGKEYTTVKEPQEFKYDAAFIGTAHSMRPRIVKQIKEQCEQMGRKCFTYFYSPHIFVYLFNKLTNKDYKYISLKEIHFDSLSTAEVCDIYNNSRCVLDIEHPKQYGITTRPIEMLPMKKKIITTNPYVKGFDFYNENNFLIIERKEPKIDESFFESPYLPVEEDILYKYSPKKFVETVLGI
ncbi:MAG: capsular biosynthesis protein CpsH [Clostridia bacterium]|nr:capsular biosynthesis protein CpsH [Clostridia bacterium]